MEGTVPFRGYETWYRRVRGGDGVPLLCLHGGPGSTHRGLTVLEPLADERDVVLYDHLGCGNSSRPSDPSLWTVDLYVDEVAAVLRACGTQLRVVGQSAVKPAAGGVANVVKVEFAGVAKSTWK